MEIEFDFAKNVLNIAKHGLDMARISDFDFDMARIAVDSRSDYRETRYQAIGMLDGIVVLVVFTMRGRTARVISLRPANRKERKEW